jgi:hypothetical protein
MTSKHYNLEGHIVDLPELFDGTPFFRKSTYSVVEKLIAKTLMRHPHPNIVQIYRVDGYMVDMELVKPIGRLNPVRLWRQMDSARKHLQRFGIMYIDWKLDNIGVDRYGNYKLFDFDVSGIAEIDRPEWRVDPLKYYIYQKAAKMYAEPQMIDNYAFFLGIIDKISQLK